MMTDTVHEFHCQVPHPIDTVFDWHRRPGALSRLLPPWQPVEIGQQAMSLRDGTTILKFPAGRAWIAQHLPEDYADGRRFVDRLDSRPFVVPISWRHEHDFRIVGDGTELVDRVHTAVPARLVRPMFAYRHRQLADDLAAHSLSAGSPRLVVAMTGASGLVGGALAAFLSSGGHRVIRLVRGGPAGPDEVHWDPTAPDPAALDGVDAVVHLAGHSIAGRFTEEHKEQVASPGSSRPGCSPARRHGLVSASSSAHPPSGSTARTEAMRCSPRTAPRETGSWPVSSRTGSGPRRRDPEMTCGWH